MLKVVIVIVLVGIAGGLWFARPRLSAQNPDDFQKLDGPTRLARARLAREAVIRARYKDAGVAYPGQVFVRWFKREAVMELWARNERGPFVRVASWPILAPSGGPGPKRREGDKQVPEGFYEIVHFNPQSLYHLSLGLNYPNAADLVLADPENPGTDIYIHGSNVSVGCAPLGDAGIEELYLATSDAHDAGQMRIAVHIFPARMVGAEWERFKRENIEQRPELSGFWAQLQPAFDAFEKSHLIPEVAVEADGRYRVSAEK